MADLEQYRDKAQKNSQDKATESRHMAQLERISSLEKTVVESIGALVEYLDSKVSKTEVVNQLEEIGTPDSQKVVAAVNDLHESLKKHKNTDLTQITEVMRGVLTQVQKLPTSFPDIPDSVQVSNLDSLNAQFDLVAKAIEHLEVNPEVNVESPTINVPEAQVSVEAPDLSPIEEGLQGVLEAVKGLIFPELNLSPVESELKKSNKYLKEIAEKPAGGGSGGGGHATPFVDGSGQSTYVYENPTDRYSISDIDESGNPSYFGYLRSDGAWYIMRNTSDTSYRYVAGASGYDWSNRASESYDLFSEVF